jgi:hypothetical protein
VTLYIDPNPNSRLGRMRIALFNLIQQHKKDGAIPTNARFLYYELVAQGVITKHEKNVNAVIYDALTNLRERDYVPWDWIEDETRSVDDYTGSSSVAQYCLDVLDHARLDPWDGEAPVVINESRSLAGTLRRLASKYAIIITSTNGQCGGFLRTDIAPKLRDGRKVLYIGDLDLAGNQIEANTRRVLEQEVGALEWERVMITDQQVKRNRLQRFVIQKFDNRYKPPRMIDAIETEALSQKLIVDILQRRLDALLPEPLGDVLEREEEQGNAIREKIEELIDD